MTHLSITNCLLSAQSAAAAGTQSIQTVERIAQMPLTGELEHLPIVDVIQLIYSTKKSGTLNVYSRKGEGQLTFNKGYIVSATHSNEKMKIGQILVESEIICQQDLDQALRLQRADATHKPLLAILLEHCGLTRELAFKGLERLIEMTVVEMISWARGIFTLDVDELKVADDYRYYPPQLQALSLDTQMVLMDALRIFDEKMHAGEIEISSEPLDTNPLSSFDTDPRTDPEPELIPDGSEVILSDDLLGLADLDQIERRKPHIFRGLEAFDPVQIHRQTLERSMPELDEDEKTALANYLGNLSSGLSHNHAGNSTKSLSQALIIFTCFEFLQHAVMSVCKKEGILVFSTAAEEEINSLIDRALNKQLEPILVFGPPSLHHEDFSQEALIDARNRKMASYPQISILQLAPPSDFSFSLQSLNDGVRAVLPLPDINQPNPGFSTDMIEFLNTFQTYIRGCFNEERRLYFARLRNSLSCMRLLKKAPDISLLVLQHVGEVFERALTLIVDKTDLIAERSIGISNDKHRGPSGPLKFRIPIRKESIFRDAILSGKAFLGSSQDTSLGQLLYPEIEAPADPTCLLLPLRSNDRTITLTYADFGHQHPRPISLDFLEFFVDQAGIAMENALFRKQLEHTNRKTNA